MLEFLLVRYRYTFLWLQKVTEQHQVTTKEVMERTRDILKVGYTVQIAAFNFLTDLE
jgi:hypothetical protein